MKPEAGDEAVKKLAAQQNQSGMETVEALAAGPWCLTARIVICF